MHKHTNLFTFTFKQKTLAQTGFHLNPFKAVNKRKSIAPKPKRHSDTNFLRTFLCSVQCRRQQLFRLPYFKHVPCHQTHKLHAHVKTKHSLFPVCFPIPFRRVSTGVRILNRPVFILMVRRCRFLFALVN